MGYIILTRLARGFGGRHRGPEDMVFALSYQLGSDMQWQRLND